MEEAIPMATPGRLPVTTKLQTREVLALAPFFVFSVGPGSFLAAVLLGSLFMFMKAVAFDERLGGPPVCPTIVFFVLWGVIAAVICVWVRRDYRKLIWAFDGRELRSPSLVGPLLMSEVTKISLGIPRPRLGILVFVKWLRPRMWEAIESLYDNTLVMFFTDGRFLALQLCQGELPESVTKRGIDLMNAVLASAPEKFDGDLKWDHPSLWRRFQGPRWNTLLPTALSSLRELPRAGTRGPT